MGTKESLIVSICVMTGTLLNAFTIIPKSFQIHNALSSSQSNHPSEEESKEVDEKIWLKTEYKRPQFSSTFLQHLEEVKASFPDKIDGEGVDCTGEPSQDPSRIVMDDGIDSEYLGDYL
jgi:hypothetical protein